MKTNTRIDAMVPWRPDFYQRSALFAPLVPLVERFAESAEWPTLDDLQRLLDERETPLRTRHGAALKIVPQEGRPDHFSRHYAPRIYLSGEIQTRRHNWHDFFQLLSWFLFPRTKAVINAIHIPLAKKRLEKGVDIGRRTPVENMLSLFDEGGAVLVAGDLSLLELVREFKWKELFWQRRDELKEQFDCVVFGHAMYEKALAPYLGMTANTILLEGDGNYFAGDRESRLAWIDERLAAIFESGEQYQKPRDLQPFPILGMPGWDPANSDESYYDNTDYFRPGRRR
ncbi:MAG: DUF3025 domain-containing protein [Pseudomonadota bacterium]